MLLLLLLMMMMVCLVTILSRTCTVSVSCALPLLLLQGRMKVAACCSRDRCDAAVARSTSSAKYNGQQTLEREGCWPGFLGRAGVLLLALLCPQQYWVYSLLHRAAKARLRAVETCFDENLVFVPLQEYSYANVHLGWVPLTSCRFLFKGSTNLSPGGDAKSSRTPNPPYNFMLFGPGNPTPLPVLGWPPY